MFTRSRQAAVAATTSTSASASAAFNAAGLATTTVMSWSAGGSDVLLLREAISPERQAEDQRAQTGGVEVQPTEVERERGGGLVPAYQGCTGLAQAAGDPSPMPASRKRSSTGAWTSSPASPLAFSRVSTAVASNATEPSTSGGLSLPAPRVGTATASAAGSAAARTTRGSWAEFIAG